MRKLHTPTSTRRMMSLSSKARAVAALLAVAAAIGCKQDSLTQVTDPDILNPGDYTTPAGATPMRVGVIADFASAFDGDVDCFVCHEIRNERIQRVLPAKYESAERDDDAVDSHDGFTDRKDRDSIDHDCDRIGTIDDTAVADYHADTEADDPAAKYGRQYRLIDQPLINVCDREQSQCDDTDSRE